MHDIELIDINSESNWNGKKAIGFEQLKFITEQIETRQIDITGNCGSDWWIIAQVCAVYGEKGKSFFHRISRFAPDYDEGEAQHKFEVAVKKGKLQGNYKLTQVCKAHEIQTNLPKDYDAVAFLPEDAVTDDYDPKEDFMAYGFFEYKNQYCKLMPNGAGYKVEPFTNFTMRVKFHMPDKKNPRRIIELKNNFHFSITVDTPTTNLSSLQKFIDLIEGLGNFRFDGGKPELAKIKRKQFDEEKKCEQIEIMGHHYDGFYVFSNGIFTYDTNEFTPTDQDGIVEFAKHSYYIPSGNQAYAKDRTAYLNEKRFRHAPAKLQFSEWSRQYINVFGSRSVIDITFAIACLFSDVIFETMEGFPILFLYGEGSSGKGTRMKSLMRLLGKPQDASKISEKANTAKAKIRELAQFVNGICGLDEFINDIPDADIKTLTGIWDRFGYKRSMADSKYGTESVPVSSGIVMTGNEYPVNDPFIQRLIALEINDNKFDEDAKKRYDKFRDATQNGVTSVALEILKHRSLVEKSYKETHRSSHTAVAGKLLGLNVTDRMINNYAVLLSVFTILENHLEWAFKEADLLKEIYEASAAQESKRESGAVVQQFWDMILFLLNENEIEQGKQIEVYGDLVLIRFKEIYPYYVSAMVKQRLSPQRQSTMRDKLLKSDAFRADKDSHRFSDKRTSAYEFYYEKLNVDLLLATIHQFEKRRKTAENDEKQPEIELKDYSEQNKKEDNEF
jgi:DNA primase